MKNLKEIITVCALALFIFATSCKTQKPLENKAIKNMPDSFTDLKDSANSANINWKQYFTDPNLIELIDVALKNNLDLSIALQKMEASKAYVRASKGALFPSVNANVNYLGRRFGYYTMDDAGNRTTEIEPGKIIPTYLPDYYMGLQASWEIDLWGKLRNKKRAALARYLSSVEGKNLVTTNLIAEVANAYYELLALDNELEIIRESIKIQQSAFNLVLVQKEAGVANELEVKQFEAQLNSSKALEYETLQNITEVENQINYLLNRYPQTIKREKEDFSKPLNIVPNIGIPSDLLKNQPDLRQAEYELMATKADLKAAKAAFYPNLNITGMLGFQGYKAVLLPQSLAYTAAGGLIAPLLNRSAIKAEFKSANAAQQEALFNYQKVILNGYIEVYNELAKIRNLEKVQEYKSNQVAALTQGIEASSVLFKTGRANYIEVLLTQQNSLNSKIELISVKQRQYNALVNIYKALGGGWK
jgi:NodT family efflux transporter outer membrane factor (OMF) lipoprotein